MKIFFIRHGETTGDLEDRYGGDYDDHLSAQGLKQSSLLAADLKDKNIKLVVSSPLTRARESAAILAEAFACPVKVEPNFKEHNRYGILTGLVKSEAKRAYPDLVIRVNNRLDTITGAEPYQDFWQRLKKAYDNLLLNSQEDTIAVVWHGGPMRALFREILKKGELREVGDCCWVELEKVGDDLIIKDSQGIVIEP